MKKAIAIIVSALFVLSVTGISFAAEQAAPAPEKKEAAPAKKAPVKVQQVTGEVGAVDAAAKTITVKGKKGDVALTTDDKTSVKMGKAKKALADVKAGDKVTVKYTEVNGKNVAKSIAVTIAPAKKEAPKAEEMKPAAAPAEKKTGGY